MSAWQFEKLKGLSSQSPYWTTTKHISCHGNRRISGYPYPYGGHSLTAWFYAQVNAIHNAIKAPALYNSSGFTYGRGEIINSILVPQKTTKHAPLYTCPFPTRIIFNSRTILALPNLTLYPRCCKCTTQPVLEYLFIRSATTTNTHVVCLRILIWS